MFSCVTNVKQKYQEKRCFIIGMKSFLDISSVPDLMAVTEDASVKNLSCIFMKYFLYTICSLFKFYILIFLC